MAFSSSLTNAPNSNTAAVVTLAANPVGVNRISLVQWSYSNTPTNGTLTIADGVTTVCKHYITASGPGSLQFGANATGSTNTAMTVTLSAGGSGVSGSVTVIE